MKGKALSLWQRLKMQLSGYVYVGDRQRPGWTGSLPFYAFKCEKHGIVQDYPHGYWALWKDSIPIVVNGVLSQLYCLKCRKEERHE